MRSIIVLKGKKRIFQALETQSRFEKAKGIMFKSADFIPLLFEFDSLSRRKNAIHSFFCTPFEAVFLDEKKRVTDLQRVPPNQLLVLPKINSLYLVEAPVGTIKKHAIREGDVLCWKPIGRSLDKKHSIM